MIFKLILTVLIPFAAGLGCIQWITRKEPLSWLIKLPLAYGLGVGMLAFWMHCLYISGRTFSFHIIGIPMLLLTIASFTLYYLQRAKRVAIDAQNPLCSESPCAKTLLPKPIYYALIGLLLIYIGQNTLFVLWRSMSMPIFSWDAIATIGFKSKVFYHEPSPPDINLLPHKAYPLLVAFLQAWAAFCVGEWNDLLIKIFFPLTFLAYMLMHYKFLADFSTKAWAIAGCAIALSSNFFIYHATIAYRDFFIMFFNCSTILLLVYWSRSKNPSFLLTASFFSGFTALTKLEGSGYFVIHAMLVLIILWQSKLHSWASSIRKFLTFAIPALIILAPWHLYKLTAGVSGMSGRMDLAVTGEGISRLPALMGEFASNLLISGNWNIIWMIFLVNIIFGFKKIAQKKEVQLLLFPLAMFFAIYLSVLTLSTAHMVNVSFGLLSRIILHFFPLTVLIIVLLNGPSIPDNQIPPKKRDPT